MKKFFEIRFSLERTMTKNELVILDLEMLRNFSPEKIKKAVRFFQIFSNFLYHYPKLEDELFYEFSSLKLLGEKYQCQKTFSENIELFAYKPPDLYKTYAERVKNPEALNKFLAFAIKSIEKSKKEYLLKVEPEEKMEDLKTYSRISKEAFQTPEIENFSQENRDKAYMELKSSGRQKQQGKKEEIKPIKDLKERVRLELRSEVNTILAKINDNKDSETKSMQGDIKEFLEKFQDLK